MNKGIAFSLPIEGLLSLALSIAIVLIIFWYYFKYLNRSKLSHLVVGLILGGALGNILDRLVHGAVVDFIKIFSWPTFNVADAAITVGFVLLLIFHKHLHKPEINS